MAGKIGRFFKSQSVRRSNDLTTGPIGAASPKTAKSGLGSFGGIFKKYNQTKAPSKNAGAFIDQEISDKEALNRKKYNSFRAGNPDMFVSYDEWDTMVTTLGNMGDTVEKFGYEAFKQLIQDLHDEGTSLSKSDMAYVINESISIMRNSDRTFTQEDAMDLLRERIYLEYGNI